MVLEIGPNGLIGDEITFQALDVDTFTFEASPGSRPVGTAHIVSCKEAVGVFDLTREWLHACISHRFLEQLLVEVVCEVAEAHPVLALGRPPMLQLGANRTEFVLFDQSNYLDSTGRAHGVSH